MPDGLPCLIPPSFPRSSKKPFSFFFLHTRYNVSLEESFFYIVIAQTTIVIGTTLVLFITKLYVKYYCHHTIGLRGVQWAKFNYRFMCVYFYLILCFNFECFTSRRDESHTLKKGAKLVPNATVNRCSCFIWIKTVDETLPGNIDFVQFPVVQFS